MGFANTGRPPPLRRPRQRGIRLGVGADFARD